VSRPGLRFDNGGDRRSLEWDVYESSPTPLWAGRATDPVWVGRLSFSTGHDEGWHFISSDDSLRVNLGPVVKLAMTELRTAYREKRLPRRPRSRKDT
jgi:hypothetical protein